MFQQMKKRIKNEKGLTLIELLAVIVILAIIAAIAIPAIGNIIDNSRIKGAKSDAINILNSANLYYTDNGTTKAAANDNDDFQEFVQTEGSFDGVTYSVSTTSPYALTGTVTLEGGITVAFNGATIEDIDSSSAGNDTNVTVTK